MRLWAGTVALGAASLLAFIACTTEAPIPGDEALGHFAFTATRVDDAGCSFSELDGGSTFGFEGTFSRLRDGTGAWFTHNGVSREGTWDGQRFEAVSTAARRFAHLECQNQFTVKETFSVALLSTAQDEVLGNDCPADPASLLAPGGVPVDPDAGVAPPTSAVDGFDAPRACGLLVEEVSSENACEFAACQIVYRVEGVRTR